MFPGAAFQPQVASGLRWRLFDFDNVDDEVLQAHGPYAETLAEFRSTILVASADVENALMMFSQDQQEEQLLLREVQVLQKSRDSSERFYAEGSIPLTDVLDADRELLHAQDSLALMRATTERSRRGLTEALHPLGKQVIIGGRRKSLLTEGAIANPSMEVAQLVRAFSPQPSLSQNTP